MTDRLRYRPDDPARRGSGSAGADVGRAARWAARGQALVESALVIPIFMLVMLGIAEGGYYVVVTTAASNATHEAARLGVLPKTAGIAAIKARLEQAAEPVLTITDSQITVKLNGVDCDDACYAGRDLGDQLTVTTAYEHRPLVSYVFSQASFDVSSTASLTVEGPDSSGSTPPSPTATPTPPPPTATPTAPPPTATPTPPPPTATPTAPPPTATPTPPPPTATPTAPPPTATPTPPPSTLLGLESFEGTFPPTGWTTGNVGEFSQGSSQVHSGTYAACKSSVTTPNTGYLTSPVIDTSTASAVTVDFWWLFGADMDKRLTLQYKNASGTWVDITSLSNKTDFDMWLHSTDSPWATTSDSQFLHSGFQFRFFADTPDNTKAQYACVDDVEVTAA